MINEGRSRDSSGLRKKNITQLKKKVFVEVGPLSSVHVCVSEGAVLLYGNIHTLQ